VDIRTPPNVTLDTNMEGKDYVDLANVLKMTQGVSFECPKAEDLNFLPDLPNGLVTVALSCILVVGRLTVCAEQMAYQATTDPSRSPVKTLWTLQKTYLVQPSIALVMPKITWKLARSPNGSHERTRRYNSKWPGQPKKPISRIRLELSAGPANRDTSPRALHKVREVREVIQKGYWRN